MTAKYARIEIHVCFDKHTIYPNVHVGLNQLYGSLLPNCGVLFMNKNQCDMLVNNAHDVLVGLIIDDMIVPNVHDSNASVINLLLWKCPFKVAYAMGKAYACLTSGALALAMNNNISNNASGLLNVTISVIPLHFPDPCDYMD